jgi:hypothetical protein
MASKGERLEGNTRDGKREGNGVLMQKAKKNCLVSVLTTVIGMEVTVY